MTILLERIEALHNKTCKTMYVVSKAQQTSCEIQQVAFQGFTHPNEIHFNGLNW